MLNKVNIELLTEDEVGSVVGALVNKNKPAEPTCVCNCPASEVITKTVVETKTDIVEVFPDLPTMTVTDISLAKRNITTITFTNKAMCTTAGNATAVPCFYLFNN